MNLLWLLFVHPHTPVPKTLVLDKSNLWLPNAPKTTSVALRELVPTGRITIPLSNSVTSRRKPSDLLVVQLPTCPLRRWQPKEHGLPVPGLALFALRTTPNAVPVLLLTVSDLTSAESWLALFATRLACYNAGVTWPTRPAWVPGLIRF